MGLARPDIQHDPMGESRFHKVLVLTADIQKIPVILIMMMILALAAVVLLVWSHEPPVAGAYVAAAFGNWLLLRLLPVFRLSYGPEKASALALAALLAVGCVLVGLLGLPSWAAFAGLTVVSALAIYATWIEPFALEVTHQQRISEHWGAQPLRVLHVGDIHMEFITPRERRLNQRIAELKPDLIVFSGDFVNISYTYDDGVKAAIREIISQWHAPLGVYCVPGTYTVEPVERVKAFTAGLDNLRLLLDEWVTIQAPGGTLNLLGMVTRHIIDTDRATFDRLNAAAPPGGFRLLVTHAPDVAPEADAAGVDLYLCGHTHGGQIRFPFIGALFSGSHLGMRFVMGRYDLEHTVVYTTRGVGLEGMGAPRARFLCPPEIILWEIRGMK